jgi:type IV secretion system protein VirB8
MGGQQQRPFGAAGDTMNAFSKGIPWRARALSAAEKEAHFAEAQSYAAEMTEMARAARRAGWIVGSIGVAIGVVGVVCAATAFPLKRTQVQFIEVDRSTGYVGPSLGPTDAPRLFNQQTADHYLRDYIEAREGYVPETDDLMFHKAAIMSAPDEQVRYAAWRKSPLSSANVLGRTGYVRVENFHMSLLGKGTAKTLVYLVRFDRVEVRGGQVEPMQPWSATVQFQWHPELPMNAQDRLLNSAGMQVIAYQAQPDGDPSKSH